MTTKKMLTFRAGGERRAYELTEAEASGLGEALAEYAVKGAILKIEVGSGPTPLWLNPSQWSDWMIG